MSALSWDHNAYYHRLLLSQLPRPCRRALDVGCGSGAFAGKLAQRVEHVDALDRSPVMIEAARRATPSNVTCILGDVLHDALPADCYDAVFSISALHHLPLGDALRRLAGTIRPGGVLAAVSLPRLDMPRDVPTALVAATGQRLLGAAFVAARSVGRGSWFAQEPTHVSMPVVLEAPLTTREVQRLAAAVLPGVQVRRLVFWRYFLLWRKPVEPGTPQHQQSTWSASASSR